MSAGTLNRPLSPAWRLYYARELASAAAHYVHLLQQQASWTKVDRTDARLTVARIHRCTRKLRQGE